MYVRTMSVSVHTFCVTLKYMHATLPRKKQNDYKLI